MDQLCVSTFAAHAHPVWSADSPDVMEQEVANLMPCGVRAGNAVAAYLILRAFSWQLRLSPVAFEEFAAALFAPQPTPYMDEVRAPAGMHISQGLQNLLGPLFLGQS